VTKNARDWLPGLQPGDTVFALEHDPAGRQPKPGAQPIALTVVEVSERHVLTECWHGERFRFGRHTGRSAWDKSSGWRLSPERPAASDD
jgi:hypothetical protein